MAEPLKNRYNEQFFEKLIHNWQNIQPSLKAQEFLQNIHNQAWEKMELKERMRHLALCMNDFLPQPYEKAVQEIVQLAHQLRKNAQEQSFEYLFLPEYILQYGIEHPKNSLQAMEEITQFVSCEFAIRPFLEQYPKESFKKMIQWSKHPEANVRRLASEGSRPRLPWAAALTSLKKDPRPLLPILENLKDDSSLYVRKSVANNLNDISKDHPQLFIELIHEWKSNSANRQWILKHASRTLLKSGHAEIMEFFDYAPTEHFKLESFQLKQNKVTFGSALEFDFQIKNLKNNASKLRLEYGIYFLKANGSHNKKVFKISERAPKASETIAVERKHPIRAITTRKYYSGEHFVVLIVNGKEIIKRNFTLVI
ncbi:MAG: DNA alkylation repair protein [Vicingaceae bacterium]